MSPRFARNRALLLKARALETSPDAVVIGRLDGRILMVNAAASRLLGCTARSAPRLVFPWLRDRDLRARVGRPAGGRTAGAEAVHRTVEARRADGTRFRASIALTVLGRGRCAPVAAHIRDLSTEGRRGAEGGDVLFYAADGAGPEAVLARIGHDLNNPLAIVVAQATMLHDLAPDADVARRAERIMAAAHRAGRIVERLAAPPPALSMTGANAAVLDALGSVSRVTEVLGIELRRDLASGLPDVLADRALLARAIEDALSSVRWAAARPAGGRTITVRTSIVGADLAIDLSIEGATFGPGLAASRAVIADHGGTIESLDGSGGGALRIAIPLPGAAPEPPRAAVLSVLIVDDEPDVAEALADVVDLLGHETHVAVSAEAALSAARGRRFDAAILDLHMPDIDGVALRSALLALDPDLAGRVAIVTGDGTGRIAGAPAPPLPTLRKPFALIDVRALLLRLASR